MSRSRGRVTGIVVTGMLVALAWPGPASAVRGASGGWASDGTTTHSLAPLDFNLSMTNFEDPSEIKLDERVELGVGVSTDDDSICVMPVALTVMKDGVPTATQGYFDPVDGEDATFTTKPITPGVYTLYVNGAYGTGGTYGEDCSATTPVTGELPLWTIPTSRKAPASTARVEITSTGRHFVVASSRRKTPAWPITYVIRDPQHRATTYSACLFNDDDGDSRGDDIRDDAQSDDCYGGPWALRAGPGIRRTADGWVVTWMEWWDRMDPGDCVNWYWYPPKVSIQLLVGNADGIVVGTRRHRFAVSCRL